MFFQLDIPQNNFSVRDITWYGLRWVSSLLLMELMTHLFYYNAFAIRWVPSNVKDSACIIYLVYVHTPTLPHMYVYAHIFIFWIILELIWTFTVLISGMWKQLYPVDVFIIGYGVRDIIALLRLLLFIVLICQVIIIFSGPFYFQNIKKHCLLVWADNLIWF